MLSVLTTVLSVLTIVRTTNLSHFPVVPHETLALICPIGTSCTAPLVGQQESQGRWTVSKMSGPEIAGAGTLVDITFEGCFLACWCLGLAGPEIDPTVAQSYSLEWVQRLELSHCMCP
jgi:hypothetical protein